MPSPNMTNFAGRSVTASATLPSVDSGSTVVLNAAAGLTITLPEATGSFAKYRLAIGTTVTSNSYIVQVTGDDVMAGMAHMTDADFNTAATSDTITMNGTTKGGIAGGVIELEDIAADTWSVSARLPASGTVATPFSAAVS